MMMQLEEIYRILLSNYGPQGWWPLTNLKGSNPTKTGSIRGYHPGEYSFPHDDAQRFEICVGAILTQNTSWPNVEKALISLCLAGALNSQNIIQMREDKLAALIRPAGYFNQKSRKLRIFAKFFEKTKDPSREELLSLWGIGEETADSMMLYAFRKPEFVVDAYTRRIFTRIGLLRSGTSNSEIKEFFEISMTKEIETYQEFHALIVEHAKRYCLKKPRCDCCTLSTECLKLV